MSDHTAPEVDPATPAETTQPVVENEAPVEGTEAAEAPAPANEEPPQSNEPPEWVKKRLAEMAARRGEEQRKREAAEREAATLRQFIEQLGPGATNADGEPITLPTQAPAPQQPQDIDALVEQRFQQKRFDDRCNEVWSEGTTKFPDFASSYKYMTDNLGDPPPEFLAQVVYQPDAPQLLHHLSKNLNDAARIFSLPPLQQGREIERLTAKLAQPPAKTVSNAPAPVATVDSPAVGSKDPSKMSIAEWMEWRNKTAT